MVMGKIGSTRDAILCGIYKKGHCHIVIKEKIPRWTWTPLYPKAAASADVYPDQKILIKYLEQHVFAMSQKEVDITLIPQ